MSSDFCGHPKCMLTNRVKKRQMCYVGDGVLDTKGDRIRRRQVKEMGESVTQASGWIVPNLDQSP